MLEANSTYLKVSFSVNTSAFDQLPVFVPCCIMARSDDVMSLVVLATKADCSIDQINVLALTNLCPNSLEGPSTVCIRTVSNDLFVPGFLDRFKFMQLFDHADGTNICHVAYTSNSCTEPGDHSVWTQYMTMYVHPPDNRPDYLHQMEFLNSGDTVVFINTSPNWSNPYDRLTEKQKATLEKRLRAFKQELSWSGAATTVLLSPRASFDIAPCIDELNFDYVVTQP